MRLTERESQEIRDAVRRHFGANAAVRVFGSRADDSKRGGDIDLYIETDMADAEQIFRSEMALLVDLNLTLGEQKIDLVVHRRGEPPTLAIHRVAQETGILL